MAKSMTHETKVVTRFAPSPTGFLHIGGARTALFNWLYAKHTRGTFALRIEDTDRTRSTNAAVEAILDGLKWLGLDWDGEPVFQFSRAHRHAEIAHEMVSRGQAFRCYVPAEVLSERRVIRDELASTDRELTDVQKKVVEDKALQPENKRALEERIKSLENKRVSLDERRLRHEAEYGSIMRVFRSPYRDDDKKQPSAGTPFVIRLKAPTTGETVIEDRVQGRVSWKNETLDDMVLLRADGTPTYMLAVVVDDHDMGVTHVIRGDDHLANAARQAQLYHAMNWNLPEFAHIPLIHGADGTKLSKRHGALGVEAYRAMGFLPTALRNYLARLGWGHGDDEVFSTEQAIRWFDLDGIGRAPARLDKARLENLNGHYIRNTSDADLMAALHRDWPELEAAQSFAGRIDEEGWRKLERAMPGLKERAKTLNELANSARYLFISRPIDLDEKAQKLLDESSRGHLRGLHARFLTLSSWAPDALEAETRAYADEVGIKLGTVAQPLRAALTGRAVSPPVFQVMDVLGREETLARIADQASSCSA